VLDEADHMLDLGFVVPIRKILAKLPKKRQSLFFSATMPKEIAGLAGEMLTNPKEVAVAPVATTAERVNQEVYLVDAAAKRGLLVELLNKPGFERTIVFTRTKRGADRVSARRWMRRASPPPPSTATRARTSASARWTSSRPARLRVLVATDIAARGIDIDSVSHVINFELPEVPEQYVHRIGRTARAGASGAAIAFCDLRARPAEGHRARHAPADPDRRQARPEGRRGHPGQRNAATRVSTRMWRVRMARVMTARASMTASVTLSVARTAPANAGIPPATTLANVTSLAGKRAASAAMRRARTVRIAAAPRASARIARVSARVLKRKPDTSGPAH
jgi:superfamily II DNA/RNA helicase